MATIEAPDATTLQAHCRRIAERVLAMDGAREVKAFLRDQVRRLLSEQTA